VPGFGIMKIVHSILSHHRAETVDAMVAAYARMAPDVAFCIGYGGSRAEFERIGWKDAFYIEEPGLRGITEQQNYFPWLCAVADWVWSRGWQPECIHFSECDHLVLRSDYWAVLARTLERSGRDFLGKWCMDRSNTNEWARLHYRNNRELLGYLDGFSQRDDKTRLWGALGNGMLLRWPALDALTRTAGRIACFTEILVPSTVHHLGFALGDMDAYGNLYRWVRHRPEFLLEHVEAFLNQGAYCCHPFKAVERLPEVWDLLRRKGQVARRLPGQRE